MGLYFGMRNSIRKNGINYEQEKINNKDPNPTIFHIVRYKEMNGHTTIIIRYPNCTNYEGIKIIVFKNTSWKEVNGLAEIDPHFTNKKTIKPFARFEPTEKGWENAIALMSLI